MARAAKARAAMCVRNVDDQGVLQFTLILAAGCVLHRRTSRVIHRQELCHNSWKSCVFHPVPNTKKTWVRKKKEERRPSLLHAGGKFPLPPHSTGPFAASPPAGYPPRAPHVGCPAVCGGCHFDRPRWARGLVRGTAPLAPEVAPRAGPPGWHSPQAHVSLRARCLLCPDPARTGPGMACGRFASR